MDTRPQGGRRTGKAAKVQKRNGGKAESVLTRRKVMYFATWGSRWWEGNGLGFEYPCGPHPSIDRLVGIWEHRFGVWG